MDSTRPLQDTWGQFGRDFLVAAGLLLALAAVYGLDAVSRPEQNGGVRSCGGTVVTKVAGTEKKAAKPLRIGVTPPSYDDIGKMLKLLGEGYEDYRTVGYDDLLDVDKLAGYDVIFFTCGGLPEEWLDERVGEGERAGTDVYTANESMMERSTVALREFVRNGGTLYASDLRFDMVARAFPEKADRDLAAKEGKQQTLTAIVVNDQLRESLGSTIDLEFDQPGWQPAAFRNCKVFLEGQYETSDGEQVQAPLLVRFPYVEGTVIFTAFHNEKQDSDVVKKLIRFLVFATVTAQSEAAMTDTMIKGGFAPSRSSIISASSDQTVTQTYDCKQRGPIQFALAFRNEPGVKLRLKVVGPDGCEEEHEGSESFIIEIPEAQAGQWKCTITALGLPYKNFPFTLTIGEKQR